jgi:Glycosyl hydrolases family 25
MTPVRQFLKFRATRSPDLSVITDWRPTWVSYASLPYASSMSMWIWIFRRNSVMIIGMLSLSATRMSGGSKQLPTRLLFTLALFGLLSGTLPIGHASAQGTCPIVNSPATFEQKGVSAEGTATPGNRGIVPQGFVALGPNRPVQHGIDVSKYQASADFVRVRDCGGAFAYVRISAGTKLDNELEYRSHWANSRSVGLLVGPYHNLVVRAPDIGFSKLSKDERHKFEQQNAEIARLQAQNFLRQFREVLSLDPAREELSLLGQPFLPIGLDVTARPMSQNSPIDQELFSKAYGIAVCAWFAEVSKDRSFATAPKILFTLPKLYEDFRLAQAPCDLSNLKFWISHRPLDGSSFTSTPDPELRALNDELCKGPGGTNRCIFEQYTSWGGFALYQPDEGLDLNRFLGTRQELEALLFQARK